MTRHPGVAVYAALAVLAALLFSVFPHLDPWSAGWFYRDGFFLSGNAVAGFVYRLVFYVTDALAILLPVALVVVLVRRRPLFGLDRLAVTFLIVALAVGPGLIVNTVLKDHWGRARPSQIVAFGGAKQFTPALEPSDQCDRNCSFPAGHPAIGFYFVSFAMLIAAARPRRIVFGAAILAGALLGLMRMAQGAHFLSDVAFSGLIVVGASWLLHEAIVRRGGIAAFTGIWRLFAVGVVCLFLGAASYFFYDRAIAVYAHGVSPGVQRVFGFITRFGKSDGYLMVTALVFVVCYFSAGRWRRWAWRAGFLFITVAASGLGVDIVKAIVGRARPKLFFRDGEYGFDWFRWGSDHWSFPSGHAATVTALALSLTTIWPCWSPAWWAAAAAVIASRIVIGAHYPSDLLGGFYIALLVWWATRDWFARRGLPLRENP
jgi:lipid A 4'-phosphatase